MAKKKPVKRIRNPKVSFVKRRKGSGNSFYIPKTDTIGRNAGIVERHVYTYHFPRVKFGQKNGSKLANHAVKLYDKLKFRYGKTLQGIAYSVVGRGATDLNEEGKPDWERQPLMVHRNYMAFKKSRHDLFSRIKAYGNNDFQSLVETGVLRGTKSRPVFFVPKTLIITCISFPKKRLKPFNKFTESKIPPWEIANTVKKTNGRKKAKKKRH